VNAFRCLLERELEHYFVTPIAYVVIATFWAASGFFFSFNALFVSAIDMVTAFHNMSLLMMLMMPLVSMRVLAEERHNGTLEFLLTLPFSELTLVLAKYTALLLVVLMMLAGSACAVLVLSLFAEPDFGPIIGGYCGVFLLAAAFAAIGILASSLATNQIVAAVLTWGVLLALWFIDYAAALVPGTPMVAWLQHISFSVQYLDLIRGVLSLAAAVYFIAISVCCVTAAAQVLAAKRL
jgi:ABC-2 type transport system permease protein